LNPNPSKSSKVSKYLDFSLVSNKNWSEILPSSGLGPGLDEVGQSGLKIRHLWHHSQKIWSIKTKHFFHYRLKDLQSLFMVWTAL